MTFALCKLDTSVEILSFLNRHL